MRIGGRMLLIPNIAGEQFDDVLGFVTFGYMKQNLGLLMQMRVGSGRILATTCRFRGNGEGVDARALSGALAQYAAGRERRPSLQVAAPAEARP